MRYLTLLLIFISSILSAQPFVTISDPGNRPASIGRGNVGYVYDISAFEITNAEYCNFLNNVASVSDNYELYSPIMTEHFFGGIKRIAEQGRYHYIPKEGYELKPVVGVSWNSAIRYVNWLHYNSANIERRVNPSQYLPLTEGDNVVGAYDTRFLEKNVFLRRNASAVYWLPNSDEWLKACYFDGQKWNEEWLAEGANCYHKSHGWKYPYPHVKNVGEDVESSPYGTYDQHGNVAEWVEDVNSNGWKLSLGGSLIRPSTFANITAFEADDAAKSISSFGFRVCRLTDSTMRTTIQNVPDNFDLNNPEREVTSSLFTDSNRGQYVLCDRPGNNGDQLYQFKGKVDYSYYIGKFELTNAEYCRFLNAVARESDPYNLWNNNMGDSVCGGIIRKSLSEGSNSYIVKDGYENKPVVYIGFYDLARYANWLHYGCPDTGRSEIGTTEGDSQNGAYNTSDFESIRSGQTKVYKNFGQRNIGALYWIPNEDEWYKAAYYDPMKIGNRQYHDYPTRTTDAPTKFQANYMIDNRLAVGAPYYVADVTDYAEYPSFFGTVQQGGNVWEWLESWQYGEIGSRGLRGGSWGYTSYGLHCCNTDPGGLDDKSYVFGGRLCHSVDSLGWQPVKENILQQSFQYVKLLSYKKYIVLLTAIFMSVLLSLLYIIHIGRKILTRKR